VIGVIGWTFTLIDFLLVAFIILRFRPHPLLSLHALLFWAYLIALNNVHVWTEAAVYYDSLIYFLLHLLLLIYLTVFLLLSINRLPSQEFFRTIRDLPIGSLAGCLWAWLAVRIWLLFTYGMASFNLLAVRDLIEASYIDTALNVFMGIIALGAFLAVVVKLGLQQRSVLHPWVIVPASVFFLFACLFNELGSARRFLLLLFFLLVLTVMSQQRNLWPTPKTILSGVLSAMVLFGMSEYYQQIRHNAENLPEVIPLINQGDISSIMEAAAIYFTPATENDNALATIDNLEIRFGPMQSLYDLTAYQVEHLKTTHGAVLAQALINAMPSFLLRNKDYVNTDHVIAEAFEMEDTDLPTGILACLQSEVAWFAYFISPALILLLIRVYSAALVKTYSIILRIVFLCMGGLTASYLEEVPDGILGNLRDVALFVVVVFALRVAAQFVRPTASASPG
jgi:hypothetical protein